MAATPLACPPSAPSPWLAAAAGVDGDLDLLPRRNSGPSVQLYNTASGPSPRKSRYATEPQSRTPRKPSVATLPASAACLYSARGRPSRIVLKPVARGDRHTAVLTADGSSSLKTSHKSKVFFDYVNVPKFSNGVFACKQTFEPPRCLRVHFFPGLHG